MFVALMFGLETRKKNGFIKIYIWCMQSQSYDNNFVLIINK